ncbi:YciI family protein [Lysobacter sp. HA18]
MRVMVLVKASKASEAGVLPDPSLFEAMGKFNEELVKAGVLLAAEGLKASSNGVRIGFDGAKRPITDGPFTETRELVAGFWLWQVRSMDEAIEWARRCPPPHADGGELEIRPVFEMDDFLELLPPELRDRETKLRAQTATP